MGRAMAEWIVHGEAEIDLHSSDVARFYDCQKTVEHVKVRAAEGFNKTYGIVHPGEQWESDRRVRLPPFYERERELGAVFFEAAGWERPHWYESNRPLLERYAERGERPRGGVGLALVVPDHQRRAPRHARQRGDVRPHRLLHLRRDRPERARQRAAGRRPPDGREGRARRLHPDPDARRRLPRRPHDHAARRRALPGRDGRRVRDGRSEVVRRPPRRGRADLRSHLGLVHPGSVGPLSRDVLASITSDDVSHEGFPFASCRTIEIDSLRGAGVADLVCRRPRVGAPRSDRAGRQAVGPRVGAGRPHGVVPAGIGVYGTPGGWSATGRTASSSTGTTTSSRRAWRGAR